MNNALDELDILKLPIANSLEAAYGILRKCYTLTDISPVHVVATILSPAYKMDFFYLITEIKKK